MAKEETQAALVAMRAQLAEQINVADRMGEPLFAAQLCEAQWRVEQLLQNQVAAPSLIVAIDTALVEATLGGA